MQPAQHSEPKQPSAEERQLGRWDFENGGYVRIAASLNIDTEAALDMIETLVQLRRKELERRQRYANEGPDDI